MSFKLLDAQSRQTGAAFPRRVYSLLVSVSVQVSQSCLVLLGSASPARQNLGGNDAEQHQYRSHPRSKLEFFLQDQESRQPCKHRLQSQNYSNIGGGNHLLRPGLDTERQCRRQNTRNQQRDPDKGLSKRASRRHRTCERMQLHRFHNQRANRQKTMAKPICNRMSCSNRALPDACASAMT